MQTKEYTRNEKAIKVRKKQYIIPCGQHKKIRHWTIENWIDYIDDYGQWL